MSPYFVMLSYAGAVSLAVVLLYHFQARVWYWHASSLVLAFVIGYVPAPESFTGPVPDAITGFLIIFFLFWGLGGILLDMSLHGHKHA